MFLNVTKIAKKIQNIKITNNYKIFNKLKQLQKHTKNYLKNKTKKGKTNTTLPKLQKLHKVTRITKKSVFSARVSYKVWGLNIEKQGY